MLVLQRKEGESILIGGCVRITILSAERGRAKIGIAAPPGIHIVREELLDPERDKQPTRRR
jgi:carbon storage regulator CsrA